MNLLAPCVAQACKADVIRDPDCRLLSRNLLQHLQVATTSSRNPSNKVAQQKSSTKVYDITNELNSMKGAYFVVMALRPACTTE